MSEIETLVERREANSFLNFGLVKKLEVMNLERSWNQLPDHVLLQIFRYLKAEVLLF